MLVATPLCLKNMTKEEFEFRVESLVGEQIERVRYFELNYEDIKNRNNNPDFDSLEYGLDFEMMSGVIKGITWGNEFVQYGISIISSLATELKESKSKNIDVSANNRWLDIIGRKIESVEVKWGWVKESGFFKKKIFYPQDFVLRFTGDKVVYISSLEICGKSHFGGTDHIDGTDHITVFFNKAIASKYIEIKE